MSEIGRAYLLEVGLKYRWWKRVKHLCEKIKPFELSNVICLGECKVKRLRVLDVLDSKELIREFIFECVKFRARTDISL